MLHLFAALAEKERALISQRTKAGLGKLKEKVARGESWISKRSGRVVTRLGNPNAAAAAQLARAQLKANADLAAERVAGVINGIVARGITSNAAIAAELNRLEIPTPAAAMRAVVGVTTRKCSECTTSGTLSELRPPVEIAAAAAV